MLFVILQQYQSAQPVHQATTGLHCQLEPSSLMCSSEHVLNNTASFTDDLMSHIYQQSLSSQTAFPKTFKSNHFEIDVLLIA
jgi:hypothetical protein